MSQLRDFLTFFIMWSSYIIFCFTLFRFRLCAYRPQLFLSVTMMTLVAYVIPIFQLQSCRPILYAVFFCVSIIVFFRIQWLQAILMVLATYAFTSSSWLAIRLIVVGFSYEQFIEASGQKSSMQTIWFALYVLLMASLLHRLRLGFTSISAYRNVPTAPIPLWMKIILSLGGLSLLIRAASSALTKELKLLDLCLVFLLFIVLFYFIYKKEADD